PGSWSELCRSWISSLFGAVAQVLYVVVGETFGFPMGGAGLGSALGAPQTGVDQLHLVRPGGRRSVAVGVAEPDAVEAEQGVRLGLYAVQSQFRIEIRVIFVKGFGVGVSIHLGDVQHIFDLVERQVAVAVIVQMGLVIDLGLILGVGVEVGSCHHCLPSDQINGSARQGVPACGHDAGEGEVKGWLTTSLYSSSAAGRHGEGGATETFPCL